MRSSPFAPLDRLLAPAPDPKRVAFLTGRRYAHRGRHGAGVVENSLAAFSVAIEAGDGIECDVQASRDGEAFVFHDYELERLTGHEGAVAARDATALEALRLTGTGETLFRLEALLTLIAGRVPLLIEIKSRDARIAAICLSVRRALEGYRGPAAIMSFNPQVGRWFADHAPRLTRGLVVTEEGKNSVRGAIERHLALWRARPDFLAYDVRDLPSRFAATARARGIPVLTWTVRSDEQESLAAVYADGPIHERA